MKINLLTIAFAFLTSLASAQINEADSTAQVISYWNIGDKQSYSVSHQKLEINGADTVENVLTTYDVDITVVDSTEKSYLVKWHYKNYNTNDTDELVKKFISLSNDIKVVIETDELGAIEGVKNWKEVSDYIRNIYETAVVDFKEEPKLKEMLAQILNIYTTKEGIEAASIQDAHQFHAFHGGKYLLHEKLEFDTTVPNMYNQSAPFNARVTVSLDEINSEDGNFILRSNTEVDAEQVTNATLDYLSSIAKSLGAPGPNKEDIGKLNHITTTASRIHNTGWLIYSIQTKTVEVPGTAQIEERIIEIK